MTIPALRLDIGIHVAVKAEKPVVRMTAQACIQTFVESASIRSDMDAVPVTDR